MPDSDEICSSACLRILDRDPRMPGSRFLRDPRAAYRLWGTENGKLRGPMGQFWPVGHGFTVTHRSLGHRSR